MTFPLFNVRRIAGLVGPTGDPCDTTCYGPIRYRAAGGAEMLLTQGGIIRPMTPSDPTLRHADQLYLSRRQPDGSWSTPAETITRRNVPWMARGDLRPSSFISAWTVGNVVPIGDKFVGIFCGCGSDPNCCTEWSFNDTPFGSCTTPFPYFNAFMFTSDNGIDGWKMVENPYGVDVGDPMLNARFMGFTPTTDADKNLPPVGPTGFKGLDKCSIGVLHSDGYWYGTADYWSPWGPKTLAWRCDLERGVRSLGRSDFIKAPHVWNGVRWITAVNGIIPAEFNTDLWHGNAFDCPAGTITLAPPGSPGRYMIALLRSPELPANERLSVSSLSVRGLGTHVAMGGGNLAIHRQIAVSFTDNFTEWMPPVPIGPLFDREVLDPQVYATEDGYIDAYWSASSCAAIWDGRAIWTGTTRPVGRKRTVRG